MLRIFGISASLVLFPLSAGAATHYVAPSGSDQNAGTEAAPLASLAGAQKLAQAGDTVYFRAGTYAFTAGTTKCSSGTATISGVVLDKDGAAGKPIHYLAYPGEVPVLDFDGIRDSCRIKGVLVTADWVHLKGFELRGVRQNNDLNHESWGLWNQGSHNVFEALNVHHIMGAGIFLQRGSDNLVLNCDSHHNLDEHTSNGAGESADGFGCHVGAGETGNVFRGCRAWWNADDGYDFINADAACTVEGSWAWLNGYEPDSMKGIGNGNGFKAGGYGADPAGFPANPAQHVVRGCLAFANKAAGFYANHHPPTAPPLFYNNTAFGNHPSFNMLGMNAQGGDVTVGVYRNNVALGGTLFSNRSGADEASNSWSLPALMVSEADFQSVATAGLDAARAADGSLPTLPNFRLAAGSDLIDAGVNVALPFAGKAPDLGAFEVGVAAVGGGGGSAGAAAGAASVGGAPMTGTSGLGGLAAGGDSGSAGNSGGSMAAEAGAGSLSGAPMEPTLAGASNEVRTPGNDSGACACRAVGPAPSAVSGVFWLALLNFGRVGRRAGRRRGRS